MGDVLYNKAEQPFDRQLEATFDFKGTIVRIALDIITIPAFASIPCSQCKTTSRESLLEAGVDLPLDDKQINVIDEIGKLIEQGATMRPMDDCRINEFAPEEQFPEDCLPSLFDPDIVYVITAAEVSQIEDITAMIDIPIFSHLGTSIKAHVEKCLVGQALCTSAECFGQDNFERLLAA